MSVRLLFSRPGLADGKEAEPEEQRSGGRRHPGGRGHARRGGCNRNAARNPASHKLVRLRLGAPVPTDGQPGRPGRGRRALYPGARDGYAVIGPADRCRSRSTITAASVLERFCKQPAAARAHGGHVTRARQPRPCSASGRSCCAVHSVADSTEPRQG